MSRPIPAQTASAASAPRAPRVLLIEDDEPFRGGVAASLRLAGFEVGDHGRAGAALQALTREAADVVLTDLRLPDLDGLALLTQCRALDADLPVIVMTGQADIETAVRAIKQGAYDFIEKPFGRERLVTLVQRAVRQVALARENRGLRSGLAVGAALSEVLCGDSAGMRALRALVLRIAPTPVDVLVLGETGTGKELVARALHEFSGRRGAFVAVNCAALPETLIESELFGHEAGAFTGAARARIGHLERAHGGTLFLDEIEAMPAGLQAKLLRVLQEREVLRLGGQAPKAVDLRVVAASNVALPPRVAEGGFRADLYYRLHVVQLTLPPLRDRREDIVPLFEHFRRGAALRFSLDPSALAPWPPALADQMLAHAWPGNVRELKSAAERQVLGLPALSAPAAGEAAPAGDAATGLQARLEALEALLLEDALRRHQGQVDAVCAELALSHATFYRKLKAHRLQLQAHRPPPGARAAG